MSRTNAKASDVFLAYAKADAELTAGVVQSFEAAGISVFHLAGLGTNAEQADEVRRRLQECLAFVAILTPYLVRESALAIEIGAAWAGSVHAHLSPAERTSPGGDSGLPPALPGQTVGIRVGFGDRGDPKTH